MHYKVFWTPSGQTVKQKCADAHTDLGMDGKITSRKHAYIILTPLKPHFYIVKLGFTGVYIIFLISAQNVDCGYSLEPPRTGGSNKYPQSMFWAEIWKISEFLSKNFQFLEMKFSMYLNRRVFVMIYWNAWLIFQHSSLKRFFFAQICYNWNLSVWNRKMKCLFL